MLVIRALLTPLPWFNDALIVAIGITAGLSFYRLLLQLPWRRQHLLAVLSTVWIASVLQCFIAVIQLFHLKAAAWWEFSPAQLRPYGIFQQVNVLASFIACGIAATLLLLLYRSKTIPWMRALLHISLTLQGFILYACQSQIGYLSTAFVILACLGIFWQQRFIIFSAIISLVAGGILSFAVHVWLQFPTVVHTDSTHTRLLIWQHSWQLFSMHPLFGWGVGRFESVFLHQFGGQITNVGIRTVSHPHNEILLWLVEGGDLPP
ncbi:O-antigen ligase family protein [Hafnia alvei]|uniref:O-antigen ligase family protein n=1 Tax=Hafnia alvei TaxID=569 RepID=UPI001F15E46E|nr:O-antigen ligase family protein [Hafnia alvei]